MHHKWQSYGVIMVPEIWSTTGFFVILDHFLPFYPPMDPEIEILEKIKKIKKKKKKKRLEMLPFYTCVSEMTIKWCVVPEILSTTNIFFCHFQPFFAFLHPNYPITLTAWEMKILQKWKKHLEMSSYYTSLLKIMIIWYTVPEIWHVTDVFYFSFWAIFCTFTP